MDYERQTRIKVWGTAEVIEDNRQLLTQLTDSQYKGKPERVIRFHVEAWDANCREHIPPQFIPGNMSMTTQALRDRITELEQENSVLRAISPI
mgnify:FL=1